tara:strand:+ start:792 stop:1148 length:357 start_codon:yes stop_codon:yes gene_type:complete
MKFLAFNSAPTGNATNEETAMIPLKNFNGMINGNTNELELHFSGFRPRGFGETDGQNDGMMIKFTVADASMFEVMSAFAEEISVFSDNDEQILTMYQLTASPIHSAASTMVIEVDERT